MDNNLHLMVFHDDGTSNIDRAHVNWERNEAHWVHAPSGAQFIAWRLVRLLWWDDQSYIAYQCGDIDDRDDEVATGNVDVPVVVEEVLAADDDLPF